MIVIAAGRRYLDIDTFASMITYRELLHATASEEVLAVSTAKVNGSGTLASFASRRHARKQKITPWVIFLFSWWLRSDLNQRHKALQASALPTELQSHENVSLL